MTNGDDGTREEVARRSRAFARRGRAGEPARVEPASATDASKGASVAANGTSHASNRTVDDGNADTDELATVEAPEQADDVTEPARLSPPELAAARTAIHRRTMEIPLVDASHPYGEDDDADPLTDEPVEEFPEHAHRPHVVVERRAGLYFTISLLAVALIAVSALAAYLWHVSEEWEAQVDELTDVSYGLGDDLAAERQTLSDAQQRIELLTDQLSTSKDTVTRLQAENARWGDDAAFAQEQISQLETLIGDGSAATATLSRCIEAHDQLVTYLDTPDAFAPEEIAAFRTSVTELCTDAVRVAQEFRAEVAE